MVQAGKQGVENSLEGYDGHTRYGEVQIKHNHRWQKEEKQREKDSAHEQLVKVVVARVYPVPENVVLFSTEQVKKGYEDVELPVVDPS